MWIDFSLLLLLPKKITGCPPRFCIACLLAPAHSPDWEPGALDVQITGNDRSALQPRVSLGESTSHTGRPAVETSNSLS